MKRIKSLEKIDAVTTSLPRGGYLVDTSAGYIQFGSPPETLKDTMRLPKSVPQVFVLPYEHFHPSQGISMAEVEFPMYFNFFIKKRKTIVFVNPDHVENMRTVLKEALFGPKKVDISNEVVKTENYFIPNLESEMKFFRNNMKLEDLIDIEEMTGKGFTLDEVKVVPREDKGFNVFDKGKLIAEVPAKMEFQIQYDLGTTLKEPFVPPEFGITCLGPSHGFDPEQNTSGFILWINKVGIMVDPPVNSTAWLKDSNVNPKLIDSVILTHCHADHDSGTFQKILEETKITIYSTPTVMQSFLTKYSALTRIPAKTLMNMFQFFPVKMNGQYNIHGAIFTFFYSLHSIPTMGFHISCRDKTFLYSSDHLNEPTIIKQMYEKGFLEKERMEFLLNFPWDFDIIYHEAGIPPLHTPVSFLNSLPKDIQKKVTVYHIAEKDFPEKTSLKLAKFGIGETLYPDIKKHKNEEAFRILDVFSRIDIFKDLPFERIKDLLLVIEEVEFKKGEYIIKKNTKGDNFYVIVSGNVSIGGVQDIEDKVYGTFEYFGEASLLSDTPRAADVIAATNVKAYSIEKQSFLRVIKGTVVESNIRRIAHVRNGVTWNVIKSNRFFKNLSSSQITQLESYLKPMEIKKGEYLIKEGERITDPYILIEGKVQTIKGSKKMHSCKSGDIIGDFLSLKEKKPSEMSFQAQSDSKVYKLKEENVRSFLDQNPGVLMEMMFERKV
ncbi:MAG: cAMP/cGMP-dependent 3',5'-cyclic-AMP/GMP phosphodiesterase [Spirochaetes bacterium]|nr:cAMP/cGMP-dependent 3',5'-cyclic-AMP/GMP phosphodiesterase [Spirochaetota bacterium]